MKRIKASIAIMLIAAIIAGTAGCATPVKAAADLMEGISQRSVTGKQTDEAFIESMADFSVELFKKSLLESKNTLISPLSVTLALAMACNGADGETLAQMETLLGGNIPLDELNEYLYSYVAGLPNKDKSVLKIANSIWFCDDQEKLQVYPGFLQKNADYYGASAYSAAFDSQTVNDINAWVKKNTDGMIDKIMERIKDDAESSALMYLINAVIFDAEWREVYNKENIRKNDFTNITGEVMNVDFMHSDESKYLDDGMATGFIKPYVDGGYSFVALLPNEDVSIEAYIGSLTGAGMLTTLNSMKPAIVKASMPKFKYEYDIKMSEALKALGAPDAFDEARADFSKMASSSLGNIWIGEVLHKTYISVDELGTKAGAVTRVSFDAPTASPDPPKPIIVHLDRPFVFAIIDNATNLPMFIGTVMTV